MLTIKPQKALSWMLNIILASSFVAIIYPDVIPLLVLPFFLMFYKFIDSEVSRAFLKPKFKKKFIIRFVCFFAISSASIYFTHWTVLIPYGSLIIYFISYELCHLLWGHYPYYINTTEKNPLHELKPGDFVPEINRKLEDIDFEWSGLQYILQFIYYVITMGILEIYFGE